MEPFASYPEPPPPPAGASSAQKALAAVAILLGMLGIIGGCWGVVGSLLGGAIMEAQGELLGAQGMPGAEGQRAFAEASRAIMAKWGMYVVLLQALNVVASSLLIAAGVQVWRAHASAAQLTLIACGSNALVDVANTLVAMAQQMELQDATRLLLPSVGDPNVDATMQSVMQFGSVLGTCFAVGWLLMKLGTYVAMSLVMRRRA